MKQLSTQLRDVLYTWGDSHQLANLYTIYAPGQTVRWTDWDAPVTSGSDTYQPFVVTKFKTSLQLGLEVDSAEVEVAPGTGTIGGTPIVQYVRGRNLDNARFRVDRAVFYTGSFVDAVPAFDGFVDGWTCEFDLVRLRVVSSLANLSKKFPERVLGDTCPFRLFGSECGVNVASYTSFCMLGSGSTTSTLEVGSGTVPPVPGGMVYVTSGPLAGSVALIHKVHGSQVLLKVPLSQAPASGTTVNITRGCDRSAGVYGCAGFSNLARYGGCRGMPPADASAKSITDAARLERARLDSRNRGQVQTYTAGKVLPYVFGTARVDPTIVWQSGLLGRGQVYVTSSIGGYCWSGGSGSPPLATLPGYVSIVRALCAAPVSGVTRFWIGKEQITTGSIGDGAVGWERLNVDPNYIGGGYPAHVTGNLNVSGDPTVYPWVTGSASGTGYNGIVTYATQYGRYDGDMKRAPDTSFEVRSLYCLSGSQDEHAADVAKFLFSRATGLPTSSIDVDTGPDGTTASSFRAFLDSVPDMRGVSRVVDTQEDFATLLKDLCEATQADPVPTGNRLRIVPRWDQPTGTFVPAVSATVLDVNELGDEMGIVTVDSPPSSEVYNRWTVSYDDRNNNYEENSISFQDEFDVQIGGPKDGGTIKNPWVTTTGHVYKLVQMVTNRSVRARSTYRFRLGPRWMALEPGDFVALSDGATLTDQIARITKITEGDDGRFDVEAREWLYGNIVPNDLTPQVTEEVEPLPFLEYSALQATSAAEVSSSVSAVAVTASAAYVTASLASGSALSASVTASQALATASQASQDAASANIAAASAGGAANYAITLANGKTKVTFAGTPPAPDSPDDLWYSTDTTTNCPDSNCKGHTLDAAGAIRTGSYPHRKQPWAHRWGGSSWVDAQGTLSITAADIVAGTVIAGVMKTLGYTEDADGTPTVGAKLDYAGTSFKVAPKNLQIGSFTVEKLLTLNQLCDISRDGGGSPLSNNVLAFDDGGSNWITVQSGAYLLSTGNTASIATYSPSALGDAVWDDARGCFQAVSNGIAGLQSIFPTASGSIGIYRRGGNGSLCIAYNRNRQELLAGPDGLTSDLLFSSNGTGYAVRTGAFPSGYVQSVASLGSYGWIAVGQNTSNNVVGSYSADGTTWTPISLPSNTGGTALNCRTSTSATCKGVVVGVVNNKVLIITQTYIWSAPLGSTLSSAASWTRVIGFLISRPPRRCRTTSTILLVSYDGWNGVAYTVDGVNWRTTFPTGQAGVTTANTQVLALATNTWLGGDIRAQVACLMGSTSGAATIRLSGQVSEIYD